MSFTEPYSRLTSKRAILGRQKTALHAIENAAGESPECLIQELAGHENKTSESIVVQYNAIGAVAGAGRDAMMVKVALLYPFYTLPLHSLKQMGFNIGQQMYATVSSFYATNGPGSFYDRPAPPGRKRHASESDIIDRWKGISHPDSSGGRKLYCPKAKHVGALAEEFGASASTIYRCGADITRSRRPEDLCDYCEALLLLRKKGMAGEKFDSGSNCDFEDPFLGQRIVRQKWQARVNEEGSIPAKQREEIKALEMHESLAATRQQLFAEDWSSGLCKETLVLLFDFSASAPLKSSRVSSQEWFNKKYVSFLGTGCPSSGGCPEVFFDVADVQKYPHNSHHSSQMFATAVRKMADIHFDRYGQYPDNLVAWSDTGRHFRSNEFIYNCTVRSKELFFPEFSSAKLRFFAEQHGKGVVDSHFSRVKQTLEADFQLDGAQSFSDVEKELRRTLGDTFVNYRPFLSGERKKLKIENLTAFHDFGYDVQSRALAVEGAERAVVTEDVVGSEDAGDADDSRGFRGFAKEAGVLAARVTKKFRVRGELGI